MARGPADGKTVAGRLALWDERLLEIVSIPEGCMGQSIAKGPIVLNYLIVRADRRTVTHHQRSDDDDIKTKLLASGGIALDPPGIEIAIEDFYAE